MGELIDYLRSVQDEPFAWGAHDCCTFTNECVRIQRGTGCFEPWLGGYKTRLGAMRRYRKAPHVVDRLDDELHRDMTLHPSTGSLVARPSDVEQVLGVSLGVIVNGSAYFVGPEGLVATKLHHLDSYWSVL